MLYYYNAMHYDIFSVHVYIPSIKNNILQNFFLSLFKTNCKFSTISN